MKIKMKKLFKVKYLLQDNNYLHSDFLIDNFLEQFSTF